VARIRVNSEVGMACCSFENSVDRQFGEKNARR
jgi:hypothetical protein